MINITDVYPFNLAVAIFGSEEDARKIYLPGISAALATLTEREQDILRKRYFDKMTLKSCGEVYGVGQERIRQIQSKAIRKLRHPTRANLVKAIPVAEMREQSLKYQKLSREYELLVKAFEALTAMRAETGIIIPMAELAITRQTPINELELSVRTYNCLRRAGKNTLGDIADTTGEEFTRVRNLGRKGMEEVVKCVERYGLRLRLQL